MAQSTGENDALPALLRGAERQYDLGCSAIQSDSYDEAVECLTKALEIRVQHYGELGPECAATYYKLGCALLYKVQAEADPLVDRNEKQEKQEGSSAAEGFKAENEVDEEEEEEEEEEEQEDEKKRGEGLGFEEKDKNAGGEGSGFAEEETGEEEEDSDLELAWKMLDIARVIYSKQPQRSLEEVDVITTLADVSLEKEQFQLCFEDYQTALSALEGLVDDDDRRIAALCFKISMAKQLDQKPKEALDYCQRAISVCERRVARLSKGGPLLSGKGKAPEGELMNGHAATTIEDAAAERKGTSLGPDSEANEDVKEMEELLVDLREKVEELQQMSTAPSLLEQFNLVEPSAVTMLKEVYSATLGVPAFGNGGSSETVTTSSTTVAQVGSSSTVVPVTNLGVIGRGVKRATLTPIIDDGQQPPDVQPKKRTAEDVMQNGSSSGETQIGFEGPS